MARAFVFPGQGSQAVGMGKELAEASPVAREVFEEIDEALQQRLSRLMFEGPEDELRLTANAQPALMAVSLATLRVLEREGGMATPRAAKFVAGHSLGEYSALCAAGALPLPEAARLLRRRGQAMQEAVPVGVGAMAALLGLELDAAREVAETARQGQVCDCANDNAPGQVVISGPTAALEGAAASLKAAGAKRVLPLRVSAAFHSPAMRAVAPDLAAAIAATALGELRVPVIANVDAAMHTRMSDFPGLLERQVWSPVRWVAVMRCAAGEGATRFIEFGAGSVLSALAKRILPDARASAVSDPATLEEALSVLR